LDSLRDGREVYFDGEGVSDITMYPRIPEFGPLGGFPENHRVRAAASIAINGAVVAEDAAGHTPAIVTITKKLPPE
jgi:hypothetical protein